MNTRTKHLAALAAVVCLGTGGARADELTINIQAEIDGRSQLILDGGTVQWHHIGWAAPGREQCNSGVPERPTFVNGVEWYPAWPDVPDCENRNCNCDSDMFLDLVPAIPDFAFTPILELITARGDCFLAELPTAANGFRVVVEFDDGPLGGPAWYEIDLVIPCGAVNYCQSTLNSTGSAAHIGMRGSMSIGSSDMILEVSNCPPETFGVFFYGHGETEYPLGDGFLCVSPYYPGLFRLPVSQADPTGSAECPMIFASAPPGGQIEPGSTWNFQFWYRDVASPGTGSNLSDALRVSFCP